LEGLISAERFDRLVAAVKERGGLVSTKRNPDGTDSPYELNISYLDALGDPENASPEWHAQRFLLSQAVMLSLRGIPGMYFHSLVGTRNDYQGVQSSGHARRINRHKYQLDRLDSLLDDPQSIQRRVFHGYQKLLRTRIAQPAFHPDADQKVWDAADPALLAYERICETSGQRILVAANLSQQPRQLECAMHGNSGFTRDLLTDTELPANTPISLQPFQIVWATT
jgi:sucrose phosphorylase